MSSRTASEHEADDLDRQLFDIAKRAYTAGWQDVAFKADAARSALRKRMHPEDRDAADNPECSFYPQRTK